MPKDGHLAAAQQLVGEEPIKACGMFALQDNYAAVLAGGAAAGAAMPRAAGAAGAAGAGIAGAIGIEAGRQANAAAEGVSERMLVAVTDGAIHILKMPMIGGEPSEELMRFSRETTQVEVKKFGLSRRLNLEDKGSGLRLGLTGSAAKFAVGGKGDKAVLAELGNQAG